MLESVINFINDVFHLEDGRTAATIIVTISVFFLGYIIRGAITFLKFTWINYEVRYSLKSLFSEIEQQTYQTHIHLDEYHLALNFDEISSTLKYKKIAHLSTLRNHDYIDIKRAFVSNFRLWKRRKQISDINKLFSNIELICDWENRYPNEVKEYYTKFNSLQDTWNSNIESVRDLFDREKMNAFTLLNSGIELDKDQREFCDFMTEVNEVFMTWSNIKDGNLRLTTLKENFLDPILQLSRNTVINHELKPRSLSYLLNALDAYTNMLNLFNEFVISIDNYSRNYSKVSRVLRNSGILK